MNYKLCRIPELDAVLVGIFLYSILFLITRGLSGEGATVVLTIPGAYKCRETVCAALQCL